MARVVHNLDTMRFLPISSRPPVFYVARHRRLGKSSVPQAGPLANKAVETLGVTGKEMAGDQVIEKVRPPPLPSWGHRSRSARSDTRMMSKTPWTA